MERNVALDYLRILANLSRCLVHAAIPYMVTYAPVWPVNEEGAWFFDFTVFEIHLFVMELFFLIAGFVFSIQFYKKSFFDLFIDRIKRILIPFIAGLLILIPIILSYFFLQEYSEKINFNILKNCYFKGWRLATEMLYPTAHLWFLYYLIFFYVFTICLSKYYEKLRLISIKKLLFYSTLISSLCMFFMPRWIVDNPLTLKPEIPSLIHYYLFFTIGFIMQKSKTQLNEINIHSKKWLATGFLSAVIAIIPQLYFEQNNHEYYNLIKILAILLYCISSYLIVFGLWGAFHNFSFKESKLLRYLTDSSYWVYIINMPLVAAIQILLISLKISIFLKFLISFITALFLSILSYEYLVRYTILGQLINRKRSRK